MKKVIKTCFSFLAGFLKKIMLYVPVMGLSALCISALVMVAVVITVDLSWLTDWLANYWSGDLEFDEDDILRWFGYGTVVFGVTLEVTARILRESFIKQWWKPRKIMLSILAGSLSIIYLLIPFQNLAEDATFLGMYMVFTVVGAVTGLSILLFSGVSYLLEEVSVKRSIIVQQEGDKIES